MLIPNPAQDPSEEPAPESVKPVDAGRNRVVPRITSSSSDSEWKREIKPSSLCVTSSVPGRWFVVASLESWQANQLQSPALRVIDCATFLTRPARIQVTGVFLIFRDWGITNVFECFVVIGQNWSHKNTQNLLYRTLCYQEWTHTHTHTHTHFSSWSKTGVKVCN